MTEGLKSGLERHLQSGLLVVCVGVVGWVGISVTNSLQAIARLEERVAYLTETVGDLKDQVRLSDGYSKTDAVRDKDAIWKAIGTLQDRVGRLEAR